MHVARRWLGLLPPLVAAGCGAADAVDSADRGGAEPAAIPAPTLTGEHASPAYRVADVAADDRGGLHLVVEGGARGALLSDRIYYFARTPTGWSAPVPISTSNAASHGARLLVEPGGEVQVFWYEDGTRSHARATTHVLFRSFSGGAWSPTAAVYEAADPFLPNPMAVAKAPDGTPHLLHTVGERGLHHVVRTAGRWRSVLHTHDGAYQPRLVRTTDAVAVVYIAALARPGRPARSDVYVRTVGELGLGEPVPVHVDPGEFAHHPQVVVDGRGVWHAVWLEGSGGAVPPVRLLYSMSDGGERWTHPAELVRADTASREVFSPRLNLDARGRLHLTFSRARAGMEDYRIYHAVREQDEWAVPRVILPDAGYARAHVEAVVDGADTLHVVWSDAAGFLRHDTLDVTG